MRQSTLSRYAAGLACALCVTAAPVLAQTQHTDDSAVPSAVAKKQKAEVKKGDPARWYRGDNTQAQRKDILEKEIAAAYAQQKTECQKMKGKERSSCLKEARLVYQHDKAAVPALLAQTPTPAIVERTDIEMGVPAGAQQGGAQYGGGQPGATQSGSQQNQQSGTPQSDNWQSGGQSGSSQSGTSQSGTPQSDMQQKDTPRSQQY